MSSQLTKIMGPAKTDEWPTPQDYFDKVNAEFRFTLDVCAFPNNAKCEKYFTPEIDGLAQDWGTETVWMNPPYGRTIGLWMAKAKDAANRGATVACLVPARTDTRWWHDNVEGQAEVRFIKGRLKFGAGKWPAPFPSVLVVYRPPLAAVA